MNDIYRFRANRKSFSHKSTTRLWRTKKNDDEEQRRTKSSTMVRPLVFNLQEGDKEQIQWWRTEKQEEDNEKNKQKKIEILIWGHLGNLWTPTDFFFRTWLLTIKISYVVKNEFPMFRVVIFSNFHCILSVFPRMGDNPIVKTKSSLI